MRKRITIEEFKTRANLIFDNFYDYSKVKITRGLKDRITVICPLHGEFEIRASHHLEGIGCKQCSIDKQKNKHWLDIANKIHNFKYDYSEFKYVNDKTKSTIICPIHGRFQKSINAHISSKQGCPECARELRNKKLSLGKEKFIRKSKMVYGEDAFDYSDVIYINNKTPIKLKCNKCGWVFECRPDNHLNGHGCPKCPKVISKWESEIVDFLVSLGVKLEQNNRELINGKELDIFLPDYNIGIECNGLYWHNESFKGKKYHLQKTIDCLKHGIRLIHIFEDEWLYKKEIVKNLLLNQLKINQHIFYGRKCSVKEINIMKCKSFFKKYNINGYLEYDISYGLFHSNKLLSVMSFRKIEDDKYELLQYTNSDNNFVIGGANKLFFRFLKDYNPQQIISYCDKRFFNGIFYKNLGFNHTYDILPKFAYVNGRKRIFNNANLPKIYDCGYECYIYNKKISD